MEEDNLIEEFYNTGEAKKLLEELANDYCVESYPDEVLIANGVPYMVAEMRDTYFLQCVDVERLVTRCEYFIESMDNYRLAVNRAYQEIKKTLDKIPRWDIKLETFVSTVEHLEEQRNRLVRGFGVERLKKQWNELNRGYYSFGPSRLDIFSMSFTKEFSAEIRLNEIVQEYRNKVEPIIDLLQPQQEESTACNNKLPDELNRDEEVKGNPTNQQAGTLKAQKPKGKPGRPTGVFEECVLCQDKERFINVLKPMIQGMKGKRLAEIITACDLAEWLDKDILTFPMIEQEFGGNGNPNGYYNYMKNQDLDKGRLQDIIRRIKAQLYA